MQKTKNKCISSCKKLEKSVCEETPKCKYVNTTLRKYCKLSSKYKKEKPDCIIVNRKTRNKKTQNKKTQNRKTIRNSLIPESIHDFIRKERVKEIESSVKK
jgi:hypothetical protein